MRILVVGAGAVGGYFGGRLLQTGRDVTFLVRPKRAAELAANGLVIKSPNGDVTLKNPPTVQAGFSENFDVVLLSCKAFDLEDAIKSFAPAVGPRTAVIPLLNGMRHIDVLDKRFGKERVLGGQCGIAATLDERGHIVQLPPVFQSLTFGERDRTMSDRVRSIAENFAPANIGSQASDNIMQEMWEKWVLLTTLASSTCLMRAPVGHILAAPGGRDFILGIRDECIAVARAADHAPRDAFLTRIEGMLMTEKSPLTASMFRDIKAGARIEADHVVGDMIARGDAAKVPVPRLRTAYTHLKAYESQRG